MFRFVVLALAVAVSVAQAGSISGGLVAGPVLGSPLGLSRTVGYGGVVSPLTAGYGAYPGYGGLIGSPLGYPYAAPLATSYSNVNGFASPYIRPGFAAAPLGLGLGYAGFGALG